MERFCKNKRRAMALLALGLVWGWHPAQRKGAGVTSADADRPGRGDYRHPEPVLSRQRHTECNAAHADGYAGSQRHFAAYSHTFADRYAAIFANFGPSPTRTRTATRTRYPTRTPLPTNTPTITLTPTPMLAWMRIQKPGPYSKISSPLQVEALIEPGADAMFTRV
jgi:hypothetical protein